MAVSLGVKAVIFTGTLAGVTIIDTIRVFKVYKKWLLKLINDLIQLDSRCLQDYDFHGSRVHYQCS